MMEQDVSATGMVRSDYWRELVSAWRASGQTAVVFCRARGINPGTFGWWRRELVRREELAVRPAPKASFVEVRMGSGRGDRGYELVLANGRRIGVPADFEEGVLRRLVAVAEGSC